MRDFIEVDTLEDFLVERQILVKTGAQPNDTSPHRSAYPVHTLDLSTEAEDEAVRRDRCANGSQCVTAGHA